MDKDLEAALKWADSADVDPQRVPFDTTRREREFSKVLAAALRARDERIKKLEADLRRLQDAVVTPSMKPSPAGYCVCGHASAYHYVDEPHACNFGYPCRCEGFKEDVF